MRAHAIILLLSIGLCAGNAASADTEETGASAGAQETVVPESDREPPQPSPYFYKSLEYGSDRVFNPVSELINGSLGILQISSRWLPLDEIDWRNGLDITWRSITNPGRTIRSYGTKDFITSEVIPGKLEWSGLQYLPNYHLHLIGGGARNRAFAEWYRAHGFRYPTVWAFATTTLHAFGVEAVEHQDEVVPTVDPVADMLIFDPGGALLFSSDRVAGFFANTLNMAIWSGQPMYNPVANTFENAGQNYALHFYFNEDHRVGVFQYWGMADLIGITVRGDDGLDWSVGVGGAVDELRPGERENGGRSFSARIEPDVGGFIHRQGSLLASIHVSSAWTQKLRINLYPGAVRMWGVSPGVFAGIRGDDFILGMSVAPLPAGIAASTR